MDKAAQPSQFRRLERGPDGRPAFYPLPDRGGFVKKMGRMALGYHTAPGVVGLFPKGTIATLIPQLFAQVNHFPLDNRL